MRLLFVALLLAACTPTPAPTSAPARTQPNPPPPPPNPNTTEPLVCNEAEPCRSLPDEIATQCARQNQTVKQGACGAAKVLVIETDPESVTFTSTKRYYDTSDKLIAYQIFVNEYGRTITYGNLAPCPIQNPTPACPPK